MSTVELAITGMTCASCANRIERKLNKLDGVTASVNYATEKAKVSFDESVTHQPAARDGRGSRLRGGPPVGRAAEPAPAAPTRCGSGCWSARCSPSP